MTSSVTNKRRLFYSTILGSLFLLGALLLSACSSGSSTTSQTPTATAAPAAPTVAPTTPASSTSGDWKTFTADKQFTINYPSAWTTNAADPLWSFSTGNDDDAKAVTVARNDTPVQDPQTMLALALPILYGSGCKAAPVSQTIINGVPYATMKPTGCVGTSTPATQILYVHLLQGSGSNFVFGCQAPTDGFGAFQQTDCEQMIASFKKAA